MSESDDVCYAAMDVVGIWCGSLVGEVVVIRSDV